MRQTDRQNLRLEGQWWISRLDSVFLHPALDHAEGRIILILAKHVHYRTVGKEKQRERERERNTDTIPLKYLANFPALNYTRSKPAVLDSTGHTTYCRHKHLTSINQSSTDSIAYCKHSHRAAFPYPFSGTCACETETSENSPRLPLFTSVREELGQDRDLT